MADLKLTKVTIRNWARMADVQLELPDHGLIVVTGSNRASNGRMASVGSGKTALGEAISYTLFGNAGRFANVKECSREPGGDTYVAVEAVLRGKPLLVECGYKCAEISPTSEGLRYTYDGKTYERGLPRQTREDLSALLGVTPLMASWTVFLDGDAIKFGRLAQDERVNLVMECLQQPKWTAYHASVSQTVRELERVVDADKGALAAAQTALNQSTEDHAAATAARKARQVEAKSAQAMLTVEIKRLHAEHAQVQDRVRAADERRKAIKPEIEALIEANAARQHAIEISINEARDATRALNGERRKLEAALLAAKTEKAGPQEKLETLLDVPDKCPTCGRNWHTKPTKDQIQKAQDAVDKAGKKVQAAEQALHAMDAKIVKAEELEYARQRELTSVGGRQKINELSNEDAGLERTTRRLLQSAADLVSQISAKERSLQGVDSNIELLKQREATLRETMERAGAAIEVAAVNLAENQAALSAAQFWRHACSPVGIPNKVLRDAVDPLNHEATRVAQVLTGGTMSIQFSTSRKKASGDTKPELAVTVTNHIGGSRLDMNSKGENGLANLIVVETLAAIGRISQRVGFRWYDEVLPNQDSRVVQSVYSRLRDIAETTGTLIFLVDHSAHAASYATHTLVVTKAGKGSKCVSTVEWA